MSRASCPSTTWRSAPTCTPSTTSSMRHCTQCLGLWRWSRTLWSGLQMSDSRASALGPASGTELLSTHPFSVLILRWPRTQFFYSASLFSDFESRVQVALWDQEHSFWIKLSATQPSWSQKVFNYLYCKDKYFSAVRSKPQNPFLAKRKSFFLKFERGLVLISIYIVFKICTIYFFLFKLLFIVFYLLEMKINNFTNVIKAWRHCVVQPATDLSCTNTHRQIIRNWADACVQIIPTLFLCLLPVNILSGMSLFLQLCFCFYVQYKDDFSPERQ